MSRAETIENYNTAFDLKLKKQSIAFDDWHITIEDGEAVVRWYDPVDIAKMEKNSFESFPFTVLKRRISVSSHLKDLEKKSIEFLKNNNTKNPHYFEITEELYAQYKNTELDDKKDKLANDMLWYRVETKDTDISRDRPYLTQLNNTPNLYYIDTLMRYYYLSGTSANSTIYAQKFIHNETVREDQKKIKERGLVLAKKILQHKEPLL